MLNPHCLLCLVFCTLLWESKSVNDVSYMHCVNLFLIVCMTWASCPNVGTQSEKILQKCAIIPCKYYRLRNIRGDQRGKYYPGGRKYYNIVSLTNTSNIANTADWETYEWTKRANIAAICQKRPPSAKLLFFQQSRKRNCTLASE